MSARRSRTLEPRRGFVHDCRCIRHHISSPVVLKLNQARLGRRIVEFHGCTEERLGPLPVGRREHACHEGQAEHVFGPAGLRRGATLEPPQRRGVGGGRHQPLAIEVGELDHGVGVVELGGLDEPVFRRAGVAGDAEAGDVHPTEVEHRAGVPGEGRLDEIFEGEVGVHRHAEAGGVGVAEFPIGGEASRRRGAPYHSTASVASCVTPTP